MLSIITLKNGTKSNFEEAQIKPDNFPDGVFRRKTVQIKNLMLFYLHFKFINNNNGKK